MFGKKKKQKLILLVSVVTFIMIMGVWIILDIQKQFDGYEADLMSPDNLARPTPDNDMIISSSIIYPNMTKSDFVIIGLANGTLFITDCPTNVYPRGFNGTHYQCDSNPWQTYHDFMRLDK